MLPMVCLPIAGLLIGIGCLIAPESAGISTYNTWPLSEAIGNACIQGGRAIFEYLSLFFAVGVAVGMARDHHGMAALSGLVSWCIVSGVAVSAGFDALGSSQLVGIVCGLVAGWCYNHCVDVTLPEVLASFGGRNCVPFITGLVSVAVAFVLVLLWPTISAGMQVFAGWALGAGAIGAGIYMFINRLLIPFGLHYVYNPLIWFDVAGVNDLPHFWLNTPATDAGMFMAGFFPIMMFALPGIALAMYVCARPEKKKRVGKVMLVGAACSCVMGVTEPIEFAFMFLSPPLYVLYALLCGIVAFVMAALPFRAGFTFSAGAMDLMLSSFTPAAHDIWLLLPVGVVCFIVFFAVFTAAIKCFDIHTPGREKDLVDGIDAALMLEGLGGAGNIKVFDHCMTRLRLEVVDAHALHEDVIMQAGALQVTFPADEMVQVVIGTRAGQVADEIMNLIEKSAQPDAE